MLKPMIFVILFTTISFLLSLINYADAYSAAEDIKTIAEFKRQQRANIIAGLNHAKIARQLVHQANWSAVGTISTNSEILNYPMVNVIAIDDNTLDGNSTGKIRFLLTDLDFTGPDWKAVNKVTMLFTDEQNLNCRKQGKDPMEPTCARTIISGEVVEIKETNNEHSDALAAFIKRHPAAKIWIKTHSFYLCELLIKHIYVLDFYGGPHTVTPEDYYKIILDSI